LSLQIRCGDLYADSAVKAFNKCAVSTRKCVPQRVTAGAYPLPAPDALVEALDVAELEGRWYISAGLNKLFDTFPCQVHYFTSPEPGKLFIKVNWRVARPNGQFYERSDLQRFVQDANTPAALFNHDNETLHYQDDWYIAAMSKDEYFLVYYRGRNDAWDGYGGAVVYTREPSLKAEYVPELSAAAAKLGLSWSDFELTDNSCPPPPVLQLAPVADLDVLADDVRVLESEAEAGLENSLQSFSRGFTVLKGTEQAAEATARAFIDREESVLKAEFAAAEKALEGVERRVMLKDILAAPGRALAALLGRG
jgi:violaxanthin de-epoxidase